jgi:hypothetical protein
VLLDGRGPGRIGQRRGRDEHDDCLLAGRLGGRRRHMQALVAQAGGDLFGHPCVRRRCDQPDDRRVQRGIWHES